MSEQNAAKMDELGDPGPRIDQDIAALVPQLKEIRRHLHKNAELSFQEVETAAYILKRLENIKGVEDISTGLGQAPPEFKGAAPIRKASLFFGGRSEKRLGRISPPQSSVIGGRMHSEEEGEEALLTRL